ncbi:MAG: hypothetical protein AVDCRST_MAG47-865, partial [uncultured Nocardioidaceae bacterium]
VRQDRERGGPGLDPRGDGRGQEGDRRNLEARLEGQDPADRPRRPGHRPPRGDRVRGHQRRGHQRGPALHRPQAGREGAPRGTGRRAQQAL